MNTQPKQAFDVFLDKCLSIVPKDPVKQTQYMYILNGIIVAVLFGFSVQNFYMVAKTGVLSYLFGGLLTLAFGFMSLFNFKQMRDAYKMLKSQESSTTNAMKELGVTPEDLERAYKTG